MNITNEYFCPWTKEYVRAGFDNKPIISYRGCAVFERRFDKWGNYVYDYVDFNLDTPTIFTQMAGCSNFDTAKKIIDAHLIAARFGAKMYWLNNFLCFSYKGKDFYSEESFLNFVDGKK